MCFWKRMETFYGKLTNVCLNHGAVNDFDIASVGY